MTTAKRITVNLTRQACDGVDQVMKHTSKNQTDAINWCISLGAAMEQYTSEGNEILLRRPNGEVERIHFV